MNCMCLYMPYKQSKPSTNSETEMCMWMYGCRSFKYEYVQSSAKSTWKLLPLKMGGILDKSVTIRQFFL